MRTVRILVIGVALTALVATGCEWHFETLDGHQNGPNGGTTNDVGSFNAAILYNGRPHVFYYDDNGGTLRHAYYNGSFWAFETLDGNGGPNGRLDGEIGMHAEGILYNGRPHIFYYDGSHGYLRHAYYNGSFWAFETLDGDGGPNGRTNGTVGMHTATILYGGRPHVFYYDTGDELRHAYYNGQAWGFETLDGNGGANGRTTRSVGEYSAALLYNGRPHVFYYDADDGALRHGCWNGSFWAFETLDGDGGPNGRTNGTVGMHTATILYGGRPHVLYYDTGDELRHAYYNGQAWGFETLDGNGGANGRTTRSVGEYSAALLYNGRPRVFYYDADDGALRHGYWNGQAWAFETLDGNGGPNGRTANDVGLFNATLLYNGRPDLFYYDADDGNLRHAWFG